MTTTSCQSTPSSITITRGESKTLRVTVYDRNKAVVDLTGSKVWFTVKERLEDVVSIISKRNLAAGGDDTQIEIILPQTGANKGRLYIFLLPDDTACLSSDTTYVFDVWIELPGGQRYAVIKRRSFTVDPSVTTSFT